MKELKVQLSDTALTACTKLQTATPQKKNRKRKHEAKNTFIYSLLFILVTLKHEHFYSRNRSSNNILTSRKKRSKALMGANHKDKAKQFIQLLRTSMILSKCSK